MSKRIWKSILLLSLFLWENIFVLGTVQLEGQNIDCIQDTEITTGTTIGNPIQNAVFRTCFFLRRFEMLKIF